MQKGIGRQNPAPRSRIGTCAIFVTLVMLLMTGMAVAQNRNSGEIRGTVLDPSGAVVPECRDHHPKYAYRRGDHTD